MMLLNKRIAMIQENFSEKCRRHLDILYDFLEENKAMADGVFPLDIRIANAVNIQHMCNKVIEDLDQVLEKGVKSYPPAKEVVDEARKYARKVWN